MSHGVRLLVVALTIPLTCTACGSKSAPTPAVTSVAVSGTAPGAGSSSQFTAVATLSDGSTPVVTSQASWQTSNPGILTVSGTGLVTGVSGGTAVVSATYQQVRGSTTVTVATSICVFTVQPQQIAVANAGGSAGVDVTFLQGPCSWTAQSNSPFITITAGASGTGNGVVTFSVAANPGAPRSGTLTVSGVTVTVNQS